MKKLGFFALPKLNLNSLEKKVENEVPRNEISEQPNKAEIPKNIHFVWVGGKLPEEKLEKIKNWREMNPEFEIMVWTDTPTKNGYLPTSSEDIKYDSFNYSDYLSSLDQFDIETQNSLKKILYSEIYLPEGNYAAVSDIVRLLALYKHGGFYFDFDEQPTDLKKLIHCLTEPIYGGGNIKERESVANNVLTSNTIKNQALLGYIKEIIQRYGENPCAELKERFLLHPLCNEESIKNIYNKYKDLFKKDLIDKGKNELDAMKMCNNLLESSENFKEFEAFLIKYHPYLYENFSRRIVDQETGPGVMKKALGDVKKLYSMLPEGDLENFQMGAEHSWWKLPPKQRDAWLQCVHLHRFIPVGELSSISDRVIENYMAKTTGDELNNNGIPLDWRNQDLSNSLSIKPEMITFHLERFQEEYQSCQILKKDEVRQEVEEDEASVQYCQLRC
ncbi:putative teichoic acid biosynthesis protein [Legionella beliardensis]|uniref:Putative teichoic acid biosynthesis protein n=1 Tax=Legionella beliardensis TaxID=91822 RepID=A0A378I181_9GAMM|nr:TcdA/TcdB catalytic glycosyltransferase domain-containing protein [Legionella beliardensis]STX28491.1 putative teichoic acid biosynthesis protein [Legionella beliardensis]